MGAHICTYELRVFYMLNQLHNVLALQMCGQVTDPDPGTVWKGPGPLILVLHLAGGMELEGVGMCLGWSPS